MLSEISAGGASGKNPVLQPAQHLFKWCRLKALFLGDIERRFIFESRLRCSQPFARNQLIAKYFDGTSDECSIPLIRLVSGRRRLANINGAVRKSNDGWVRLRSVFRFLL